MYHLNTQLPAPYELNTGASTSGASPYSFNAQPEEQQPTPPGMMARGGRAKRKKVIAHFNPQELHALDHLQGHQERCGKTGLRSYSGLEELLKNPHIVQNVHKSARRHAEGGGIHTIPELRHLAEGGRNGDTELALIGPHTHHLFNQLAGHSTVNPHTGHPEYWSLGNALSGAWDTIKGAGSGAWDAVKGAGRSLLPVAGHALGTMAGGAAGGALGGAAGNWLGSQLGGDESSPGAQALSQGAQNAFNAYRGGASAGQALGHGVGHAGSRLGGGLGTAMQGAGSALRQGQGLGGALSRGAASGFNHMGGTQGLAQSGTNILNRVKANPSFSTAGGALTDEAQQYKNRFLPSFRP